jgi:membrane protease YdiL (CAAX protease family)
MSDPGAASSVWARLPITPRAIVSGLAIGLIGANVWSLLLIACGPLIASIVEPVFLILYLWWASGRGPPRGTAEARLRAFRAPTLSPAGWFWGLIAAVAFAASVHSAIVILFRLVPFPVAQFRQGYDFSFIAGTPLRWVVVVISALSAGVCEETGFRGYMQQPLEVRFSPRWAILTSAALFTVLHLNKGFAGLGMVPIILGAGLLLGTLAWASRSLIPGIIGHTIMDIGLFAYWWTGIAGTFTARPIGETGVNAGFVIAVGVFALALAVCLTGIWRLHRIAVRVFGGKGCA